MRRSLIFNADASTDQWPKNNHNRMITGIGTPSNQSKIPRPITASSNQIPIRRKTRRAV